MSAPFLFLEATVAKKKRWQSDPETKPEEVEEKPEDPGPIEDTQDIPAEELKEPAKADESSTDPVEELPAIPLKVFVKLAGPKWDQMAGFLSYAKLKNMKPRTMPEWRAAYQAFLRKPTR
jgi:hypothetical protein